MEIEGRQHIHIPKQLYADLERDYWSEQDGFRTTRMTNARVDENVEEIADSTAKVARRRFHEEKDADEDEGEDEDEGW